MRVRVIFELGIPDNDFSFNEISEWVSFELGQGSIPVDSELGEFDFEPEQIDISPA